MFLSFLKAIDTRHPRTEKKDDGGHVMKLNYFFNQHVSKRFGRYMEYHAELYSPLSEIII